MFGLRRRPAPAKDPVLFARVLEWIDVTSDGLPSPEPALEGVRWSQRSWLVAPADEAGRRHIAHACVATAALLVSGETAAGLIGRPPSWIGTRAALVLGLREEEAALVFHPDVARWQLSLAEWAFAFNCRIDPEMLSYPPPPRMADLLPLAARA